MTDPIRQATYENVVRADAAGVAFDQEARFGFCIDCGESADVLIRTHDGNRLPWEFCLEHATPEVFETYTTSLREARND